MEVIKLNNEDKLSNLLVCILYFILGVVLIGATNEFIKTFNYILVSISLIVGVVQLINFFMKKKYKDNNYVDLFLAVLFIWISLVLYVYYSFMIIILPMLFSLYLFVMAIEMLIKYINVKDKKYLILFFVGIVVGMLLIFNPGSVIFIYLKIAGGYLIVVSILLFIMYLKKRKENGSVK